MDHRALQEKQRQHRQGKHLIPEWTAESFERAFEISYTHNSTAIEGNTLTLLETKLILEDRISVGGKDLREIYEQVNHHAAYRYIKEQIARGERLRENMVKDIHELLMTGIMQGGIYRDVDVYLPCARHTPPSPLELYRQVKDFYIDLKWKEELLDAVSLAAWTHAEFVRIHPFRDGNGRTSRLLMNYQLMAKGFPAVDIAKEDRLEYYSALEAYAVSGDLGPFTDVVAGLVEQRLDQYIRMIAQAQVQGPVMRM